MNESLNELETYLSHASNLPFVLETTLFETLEELLCNSTTDVESRLHELSVNVLALCPANDRSAATTSFLELLLKFLTKHFIIRRAHHQHLNSSLHAITNLCEKSTYHQILVQNVLPLDVLLHLSALPSTESVKFELAALVRHLTTQDAKISELTKAIGILKNVCTSPSRPCIVQIEICKAIDSIRTKHSEWAAALVQHSSLFRLFLNHSRTGQCTINCISSLLNLVDIVARPDLLNTDLSAELVSSGLLPLFSVIARNARYKTLFPVMCGIVSRLIHNQPLLIDELLETPLLARMFSLVTLDDDHVRREATHVIETFLTNASDRNVRRAIETNLIGNVVGLFEIPNPVVTKHVLRVFHMFFIHVRSLGYFSNFRERLATTNAQVYLEYWANNRDPEIVVYASAFLDNLEDSRRRFVVEA